MKIDVPDGILTASWYYQEKQMGWAVMPKREKNPKPRRKALVNRKISAPTASET